MAHEHFQWLNEVGETITREYDQLQNQTSGTPSRIQQTGHRAEAKWAALLSAWLPPSYEVATRKYLLLEDEAGPDTSKETDIVVFHPSYPTHLRTNAAVLVSGVVAAFSVKTTLDRSGIEDAVSEAAAVKNGVMSRGYTARCDVEASPVYGLLAHSHCWKAPNSDPEANVSAALEEFDMVYSKTPRSGLDLVCVADLSLWSRHAMGITREMASEINRLSGQNLWREGIQSGFMKLDRSDSAEGSQMGVAPVAAFVSSLWTKLARHSPELTSIADGLRVTGTGGTATADMRWWAFDEVFSTGTLDNLRTGRLSTETFSWP
ncbi:MULTISPECIES: DUF6602 domain-containing protein [unclassified Rhodococcus (in: high G+C Gram-positive bacteria)]|uniref:DUF6602 domain-containing protein n=1 Tax=unclassified Rhodococcus (in: high G+C Gram-positive bacteria) TaxID=192944 RepID=UPI001AEA191D|nr:MULTISPECIES: DUF6602 domain-containing protein [unclassified Rhodococcus (in: high G+C Gram-positive bacteria)]MBP2524266.1 hypothetical protein [Rhodococcus sp. PvP104]MDA3637452.1 hypothetical protein [Rhodococcus sp. C-2]